MYSFLQALAVVLTGAGTLCLISHLSGQIRIGSASEASLVGGLIALVLGVILPALADLGSRLIRIEKEGGSSQPVDLTESK